MANLRLLLSTLIPLVVAVGLAPPAAGHVCGDVFARNNVEHLKQLLGNCTVIAGSLQIALMEKTTRWHFERVSFPNLIEVNGAVLIYRVLGLTDLGKLLPNLRVIKGVKLIEDFSIVIYKAPDMRRLGLTKLKRIERGSVRISQSPKLCYVNTVNWKRLNTDLVLINDTSYGRCNESCPEECKGSCWSETECMDTTPLKICKRFEDDGECVDKCPSHKYPLIPGNKCIDKDDCDRLIVGLSSTKWFIANGTCTNRLPPLLDCEPPEIVTSLEVLEKLKDCRYVNSSLVIRIDKDNIAEHLEQYLGNVVTIRDYLKVYRSPAIKNLKFLQNLRRIEGSILSNGNAVVLLENHNLVELWDWDNFSMTIDRGNLSFHYNHRLCLSEIKKFSLLTGRGDLQDWEVSPLSNGDQGICEPFKHEIKISNLNPTNVTLQWDIINSTTDGYFVYYTEADQASSDICDKDWAVVVGSANTKVVISNLKPYTNYTYYLMMNSNSMHPYSRTRQWFFKTKPDDPDGPERVAAVSEEWDTMTIMWEPPRKRNGELWRYVVWKIEEPDDPVFIGQRNFCQNPAKREKFSYHSIVVPKKIHNGTCHCEAEVGRDVMQNFCSRMPTNNHLYMKHNCEAFRMEYKNAIEFEEHFEKQNARDKRNTDLEYYAGADETNLTINNLQPFTIYIFMVSVCNKNPDNDRLLCSEVVMVSNRTKPKLESDDVKNWHVQANGADVEISWGEPPSPNSMIVSYRIIYRHLEIADAKQDDICITQQKYRELGGVYRLKLQPGSYGFRMQAVSLAGPGRYTDEHSVLIESYQEHSPHKQSHSALAWTLSFCLLAVIALVTFFFYCRWKKKHEHEKLHLITSVNPDYAGPVYQEDEWEMERSNIDVHKEKEIGQGTFGMVYSGFIKSKKSPCAIKTVNETARLEDRIEFLNEASVMKSFSDAHHVVRLLGVVSRGQPPLVVMELMACGDLKTFLRRSRDSSQTITCNEMYRMAAEIADGMAYLAAKKFVHRDLAARNCMVSADHTIKVGDFGMARDIYETDYYRKETKGLLPVRWMAPESLADGVFTTDSDVWSYGVVLWEMVTLAEQPYQGLSNEQVLQFIIAQGTLDRPMHCPDLLYEIMQVCWKWIPNHRPLFTDIVQKLERHVGQDFRLVSFYHSREGEESRLNARARPLNPPAMAVAPDGELFAHYNVSDEDISLYNNDRHQRHSRLSDYSLHISPPH